MNRKELIEQIEIAVNKTKKELKEGNIHGCFILIREKRSTEIQVY